MKMKLKEPISFGDIILLIIVIASYIFLWDAYKNTTDATIKGVIITAIVGALGTAIGWRFGSSKSSANKDETIASLQNNAAKPDIKADTINTDNIDTVNTNTVQTH